MNPCLKHYKFLFKKRSNYVYHNLVGRRALTTTVLKLKPNESSGNAVIEPNKNQQNNVSNVLGYYGSNLMSISSRFFKEFNKYYKNLNESTQNNRIQLASSQATNNKNDQTEIKTNNKLEKQPIILKDVKQEDTIIKPIYSSNNNNNIPIQQSASPQQQKSHITQSSSQTLDDKISYLCNSIERASSLLLKSRLINDLFNLLYNERDASYIIYKKHKNILIHLLNLKLVAEDKRDKSLVGNINQVLSILGHVETNSIKHRSINILSIDGGGAKGFVAIEILKNIEKHSKKPIHEIFDYICGVSTGAVLAALLGIYK